MRVLFLAVLAVVAASACSAAFPTRTLFGAQPNMALVADEDPGCCISSTRWSYNSTTQSSDPQQGFTQMYVAIDSSKKIFFEAADQYLPNGTENHFATWISQGSSGQWQQTIYLPSMPDTCFVQDIDEPAGMFSQPCFEQPEWTLLGGVTFGPVLTLVWQIGQEGDESFVYVQPGTCVPMGSIYVNSGGVTSGFFLNQALSAPDAAFNVPTGCTPISLAMAEHHPASKALRRHSKRSHPF